MASSHFPKFSLVILFQFHLFIWKLTEPFCKNCTIYRSSRLLKNTSTLLSPSSHTWRCLLCVFVPMVWISSSAHNDSCRVPDVGEQWCTPLELRKVWWIDAKTSGASMPRMSGTLLAKVRPSCVGPGAYVSMALAALPFLCFFLPLLVDHSTRLHRCFSCATCVRDKFSLKDGLVVFIMWPTMDQRLQSKQVEPKHHWQS